MSYQRALTAAVAAMFGLFAATANANHIDSFTDQFFENTSSSGGLVMSVQSDPDMVGGERDVALDVLSGAGFVNAGTLSSGLVMSNSVGVLGQFMLTYDGAGSAGLGGLDFASSYDRIDVDFTQVQGQGDLTLQVTDTAGGTASIAETVTSSGVVSFPFASFAGVDFAAVDIVKLTLDTTEAASDFEIKEISREGVPEPATSLLAGLSLVSLLGLRRRRK